MTCLMSVIYTPLTSVSAKPPTHPPTLSLASSLSLSPLFSLFGSGNQGAEVSVRAGVLVGDKSERSLFEEPSHVFRRKVMVCLYAERERERESVCVCV